jgi:NADP-dependent 3-hydroxy acid dehydrogenase YdfG
MSKIILITGASSSFGRDTAPDVGRMPFVDLVKALVAKKRFVLLRRLQAF